MTTTHPTLYKRTSTGATQTWWQEVDDDKYRTHSGQLGGAITTSEWTTAKPKNVGKANASTGPQQAEVEVAANYVLKRKRGYTDSPNIAAVSERFQPMLAKVFEDERKHLDKLLARGSVCVQPKLDGIRCIARAEGLFSRNGTEIVATPHVHAALAPLFAADPDLVLDGELYNHDLKHDFPELVSLVRKTKPTPEDLAASEVMQYWVYDLPSSLNGFAVRQRELFELLGTYSPAHTVCVNTQAVACIQAIDEHFQACVTDGYEGSMIRDPESVYENKRSKSLLKYKPEQDAEFEIVEILEGVGGNSAGMAGRIRVRLPSGIVSGANAMGTREAKRKMLANKDALVGKLATVLFYGYTPEGMLRFGRVKVIHELDRW